MRILGLSDARRPAAALVIDDELVATAASDEPAGAFPWSPLEAVLERAGLELADVHRVVFGTATPPGDRLARRGDLLGSLRAGARFVGKLALKESGTWVVSASMRREREAARLRQRGFSGDVKTLEGAHAQATAAWRLQSVERALVIAADSGEDGTAVTVSLGSNEGLRLVYRQSGLSSLRNLDAAVARALGVPRAELGRIAPYLAEQGGAPLELEQRFARELHASTGGFNLALTDRRRPLARWLRRHAPEDVAAAYQANLERQFRKLVRHWIRRTGRERVVLAGDAFRNRGLVRAMVELDELETLFVAPADGGAFLALGAALWYADLGPGYRAPLHVDAPWTDEACRRAVEDAGLPLRRPSALLDRAAGLLSRGAVVARGVAGEAWWPRELGACAVLWRPGDADTAARVERRLGRRAHERPVVLTGTVGAALLVDELERVPDGGRYGGQPLRVVARHREGLAPALHGDETVDLQVVEVADDADLAVLIRDGAADPTAPALLGTDLRLEGRPRPRTPAQALGAFLAARLDHIVLGPYLVAHPDPA